MNKKKSVKLTTVLIVLLLIALIIAIVIKLNLSRTESDCKQDDVISMFESDDSQSDGEYTLKTNPDDDGFGTEVGM